ncbi:hypothetical protein ACR9E3_01165 [Actinomycetospora sp. C-140]
MSWPPEPKPRLLVAVAETEPCADTPVSTAARDTGTVRGGGDPPLLHPAAATISVIIAMAPTAFRGERKIMLGPTTFKQLSDDSSVARAAHVTPSIGGVFVTRPH